MKHFSKQLSWLLAFVLIFTNIVPIGIPVYASGTMTIGEDTDEVIVAGTQVEADCWWGNICITYYESADADHVLYEDNYTNTIGPYDIATKPYAWHITFVKKEEDNSGTSGPTTYYFKAYPDTSLENIPENEQITLPEGTMLTTTGPAITVSLYVGGTKLTDELVSSSVTLPSVSELGSQLGEAQFNAALETADYHLPDLTQLFYTVELTDKSTSPYSLNLTLVPTVEVIFDENTGTPDLAGTKMYAIPNATIGSTKLPTVSKDNVDFYGWKKPDSTYVFLTNLTDPSQVTPRVSSTSELKAMYKEIKPTFKLDAINKKVTNLLPNTTYAYPEFNWDTYDDTTIDSDANGKFAYETLPSFESYAQLRLNSQDPSISIHSDYVSLKHNKPNNPVIKYTQTTANVTNLNDFANCEFAIRNANDNSSLNWGASSTFTGLTPETEYIIYARHVTDEYGFESDPSNSAVFTTSAVKAVSNDVPNGVTMADIPIQIHTNSAIEPVLVIKDGDKTLVQGEDYTINYTNNINVGTATATVTFMNSYSGMMTKNFEIAYLRFVSFDKNGGTGAMSNVSIIDGEQYTLPTCTFTAPVNKTFKGWHVGGIEYAVGATCTITADTMVQAIWEDLEKVKTPVISPKGGTFSSSQTVTIVSETTDAIIYYTTNGTEPTKGSTIYSAPFTITSSVTVKAIAVKEGMINSDTASTSFTKSSSNSGGSSTSTPTYTAPTFTVKFNTDGGSTIDNMSIKEGTTVGEIPAPKKEGYVFDGWYSDKDLTMTYDANTKITASTTLYAKWKKIEPQPTDNSKNEFVLTLGKNDTNVFGIDKTNDFIPIIKNNRTMLPARFIAESMGAEVTWNGKKQEVTIKGKNKKGEDVIIILYTNSDIAYVNGKKVNLDSPTFIQNGRLFTPLRFLAEQLGANVLWILEEKKVVITK